METICSYYNTQGQYINVLWDNEREVTLILNYTTSELHQITEMKNMIVDTMLFIADDFECLDYCDDEYMKITKEELDDLVVCAKCGHKFKDELEENGIEIKEEYC